MTLAELIAQFRVDADDLVEGYLASDVQVTSWLNEAEEEAALRARLIHDADTEAVCSIAVTAGTAAYTLHAAVFQVTKALFTPAGETDPIDLTLTDRIELDRIRPSWRTLTEEPRDLMVEETKVRFGCIPDTNGTLALEVYRGPLAPMALGSDSTATPEIAGLHHRHMVHWALHRHYARPDAEIHDPGRSKKEEDAFTAIFGIRPDADMRRSFKANRPQFNKAIW